MADSSVWLFAYAHWLVMNAQTQMLICETSLIVIGVRLEEN